MCHVAVVQHAMQRTDRALDTLDAAIRLAPKGWTDDFVLSMLLIRVRLVIDSKSCHSIETLKEPPMQSSLCKFERASILFAAERYDEALAELEELKELVPKESPVYFLLGKVSLPIAASTLLILFSSTNISFLFFSSASGAQQAEQHPHGPYALFLGDGPRPEGRQLADQGRPRPHHQQQARLNHTHVNHTILLKK